MFAALFLVALIVGAAVLAVRWESNHPSDPRHDGSDHTWHG